MAAPSLPQGTIGLTLGDTCEILRLCVCVYVHTRVCDVSVGGYVRARACVCVRTRLCGVSVGGYVRMLACVCVCVHTCV